MSKGSVSPTDIANWRNLREEGLISAVGEYTPSEFWDALDVIEELRLENSRLRETLATLSNTINIVGSPYHQALLALEEMVFSTKKTIRKTLERT